MDKLIKQFLPKIFLLGVALAFFAISCEPESSGESTQVDETNTNTNIAPTTTDPNENLLTPDNYGSYEARQLGYTIIHEDTNTSNDDEKCGTGGARYSRNGKSMCDIFTEDDDWYSSTDAANTACPPGYVRVDQAGIGRENLAGSTRQCRTTTKVTTTDEVAHYYCPHGPNLLGYRSGAAASIYGVCQMKCDPDVINQYLAECGWGNTTTTIAPTPIIPPPPVIPYVPRTPDPQVVQVTTTTSTTTTTTLPDIPVVPNTTLPNVPAEPEPEDNFDPDKANPNLPETYLQSSPDLSGLHIVKIATRFWIESKDWTPRVDINKLEGIEYRAVATPIDLKIVINGLDTENGNVSHINEEIGCGDKASDWVNVESPEDETICSHTWTNAGDYEISAKIKWSIRWTSLLTLKNYFTTKTTFSPVSTINVTEAQALIIS